MKAARFAVPAAVVVALGATGVWRAAADDGSGGRGSSGSKAPATATATVQRKDLDETADLDGTLGYGTTRNLTLSAQGTITALPAVGTTIGRGQEVAEVDGKPIPLLIGNRPLWRDLGSGVTDGPDVAEVEYNLVALGVTGADDITVDQTWTAATTAAVKAWQSALGLDDTGRLSPGSVVIQPTAVRVVAQTGSLGSPAQGPALSVSDTVRQVSVSLDATKQDMVHQGQAVTVVLPDNSTVKGKVAKIGTVATAASNDNSDPGGGDNPPTIDVTVSLDNPAASGKLDSAPVTVKVVTSTAKNALAVPVDALLALSEGGYGVERRGAGGTSSLVAVKLGAFADGWVQVTGDLAAGDEVAVPAT